MFTLTVSIDNLDDVVMAWSEACRAMSDGAREGVAKACVEGAAEAQRLAAVKTGKMKAETTGRVITSTPGGAVGEIVAAASYSSFVEEGTAPHEIRGNPLAFEVGGETVFARRVQHPGTRSQPFMGPALQKAERVLVREAEIALEKAVEIMNQ